MSGVMAIVVRLLGVDAGAIARRPEKEKGAPDVVPGAPLHRPNGRLVAAIMVRTVVPVRRLARDSIFEPLDAPLDRPRFSRLDAVAGRAIDLPLDRARLVVERARLAVRHDPADLEVADVGANS